MPRFACTSRFAHSGNSVALCCIAEHTELFEISLRLWNYKSPSEMSLFQIRFSGVLRCFILFRVLHLNNETVVEVPLVTKYRNKYKICFNCLATKTNSLLYCSLLVISTDPHLKWDIIKGGTFTTYLQLTTKYDTLGIWRWSTVCCTLTQQTCYSWLSVFLERAAVFLAPPCHVSPSAGQSEEIRYSSQELLSALVCVNFCQRPINIALDKIKGLKWIVLPTALWSNYTLC